MRGRFARMTGAFVLGLALFGGVVWWQLDAARSTSQNVGDGGLGDFSAVDLGGPFSLVDHTGDRVANSDFDADFLLIFFGFAFCPDICPTELAEIAQTMDVLGDEGARVQPVTSVQTSHTPRMYCSRSANDVSWSIAHTTIDDVLCRPSVNMKPSGTDRHDTDACSPG